MKALFRTTSIALILSTSSVLAQGDAFPAEAESPTKSSGPQTPETKQAKELVTRYLAAVKAKKWADAKKLLHPDTIKAIAERKKRLGKEDHPMAPWFHEKSSYFLKEFKVGDARSAANGSVIVESSEDNFQVQEKGIS